MSIAIDFSSFPTPEDEERARRFQVFKYYLENIAGFLEEAYGAYPDPGLSALVSVQRDLKSFGRIQRTANPDLAELARCLGLAWASEIQLHLADGSGKALLRYSNAWAPVHAYYAIYLNLQAWFAVMGYQGLTDDHTSSLRTVANQLTTRTLFPEPWSVSARGCPQLDDCGYLRLPSGINPNAPIELLSAPDMETFWPRYCKLLSTTRAIRLERHFREWMRERNRKKTFAHEKIAIESKLLPTTLFDVFWRLRVRANYRDVSTVLQSGVSDYWQNDYHSALLALTDATCTLLHALIAEYVGKDVLTQVVANFVAGHTGGIGDLTTFLSRRNATVCN